LCPIKSKYDPDNEYYQETLSELNFDGIMLNTEKKTRFQIINYNPIEVNLVALKISAVKIKQPLVDNCQCGGNNEKVHTYL
jgi:hypothetical protein